MQKLFLDDDNYLKEPEGTIAHRAKAATPEKINALLGDWDFKRAPFEHQKRCTMIGCYTDGFIFNLDMGGGKTKIGVDLFNIKKNLVTHPDDKFKKAQRCLVICPPTIVNQWRKEFGLNSDINDITVVAGTPQAKIKQFESSTDNVVIVSHHWLLKYLSGRAGTPAEKTVREQLSSFDTLLVDDIDSIGNYNTAGFKNYKKFLSGISNRYILSATLFNIKHENIWSLYYLIDHGKTFGTNYREFLNKFFNKYENERYTKYYLRRDREQEFLQKMWRYVIRYETNECIDLPEQIWNTIDLSMTPEQTKLYDERLQTGKIYEELHMKKDPNLTTDLMKICSGLGLKQSPKLEHVGHLVAKSRGHSPQIIIWHHLQDEAPFLRDYLQKKFPDLKLACYGGPTAMNQKTKILADWENQKIDVLIANVSALSHGVDMLKSAAVAIYFSNSYSMTGRAQSEKRIHRPGQTNKCLYYDVVMRGGIDQIILNSLRAKIVKFKKLVRDKEVTVESEVAAQINNRDVTALGNNLAREL